MINSTQVTNGKMKHIQKVFFFEPKKFNIYVVFIICNI